MQCKIYTQGTLPAYKYVVVLSRYRGQILLSRPGERTTWETQGGHIERHETPLDAAKRELYEECGAEAYTICPLFDYWAGDDTTGAAGMVFFADIERLGDMPRSEMRAVATFSTLPSNLTYPGITPKLFACAKAYFPGCTLSDAASGL